MSVLGTTTKMREVWSAEHDPRLLAAVAYRRLPSFHVLFVVPLSLIRYVQSKNKHLCSKVVVGKLGGRCRICGADR